MSVPVLTAQYTDTIGIFRYIESKLFFRGIISGKALIKSMPSRDELA